MKKIEHIDAFYMKEVNKVEKPRISQHQLRIITIGSITVTGHLLYVPIVFHIAGRDGWLTLPFALMMGLLLAVILSTLGTSMPGQSIIEIYSSTLGKLLGKTVGLLYAGYFALVISITLGALIDFMTSAFMPGTSSFILGFTFLLICASAVFLGLESFLRANEFFFPFLVAAGVIISVVILPTKKYRLLLPIMEDGFDPILRGSIPLIALLAEMVVIGMIQPNLNKLAALRKSNIVAVLVIGMLFVGPLTGPIAIFGKESAMIRLYPTYEEIRQIQLTGIGSLSPLAVFLWLFGSFGKISLFYYAATLSVAHVFGVSQYKKLILPVGLIVFIFTLVAFPNIRVIRRFLMNDYVYISICFGFVFPIVILGIIRLKNKIKSGLNQD